MIGPFIFKEKFNVSSECIPSNNINDFSRLLKLSPDGNLLLCSTELNSVDVLTLPESIVNENRYYKNSIVNSGGSTWSNVSSFDNGESVYDLSWYPHMKSNDPQTCCYLMTSKDRPIHLLDINSHTTRASYNGMIYCCIFLCVHTLSYRY